MKLKPIINQLSKYMPEYTSLFSDTHQLVQVFSSVSQAYGVTSVPHGFQAGQYVYIQGISPRVDITAARLQNGNQVVYQTALDHGLNTTFDFKEQEGLDRVTPKAYLFNFIDTQFNGAFDIVAVPNRTHFIIQLPFTPTAAPALSGYLERHAANYYNGYQKINSITSATQFEFVIDPISPDFTNDIGTVHSGLRISGAVNINRFLESYTKQNINKYWMVVCPDRLRVSKDRRIPNDSLTVNHYGQDFRQFTIEPFHIYVAVPVSPQLSARDGYDSLYDVRTAIFKSLLLFNPPQDLSANNNYRLCFDSMDVFEYNTSVLVGMFSFFVNDVITYKDTFKNDLNSPFRNIQSTLKISEAEVLSSINLDVDPDFT